MTIQLLCDVCRQPKDDTEHFSLVRHKTKAEADDGRRGRREYAGSIDLCSGCIERYTHDGRDSAHKMLKARQRLGMGEGRPVTISMPHTEE